VCGTGSSGTLTASAPVEVVGKAAEDLAGAAVAAEAMTTLPGGDVTIDCADDIAPAGYTALGPAVTLGPQGAWSDRPFSITLPYKAARLPEGASRRHVRIAVVRHVGDGTPFFSPVSNLLHDDTDAYASRVTFRAGELATYQAVVADDAGQPVQRRYTYRAIMGVSMGGNAAVRIGLKHHDEFDMIGTLGGDPGMSTPYMLNMLTEYLFGGFCTAEDQANGNGNIGEMCLGQQRPVLADQFERAQNFEAQLFEEGDGTGLTLRRELYLRGFRDMARAFGNPALYNPDNSYSPPGVPMSYMQMQDRCGSPIVLANFYDREYNPDGSMPVITFCDGGDSTAQGIGVFDPSVPQDNPYEPLLAVDVNQNGVRDSGEPVITNSTEPWQDIGVDGLANADEPGYDATTNPDPNGDDFHYQRNPRGTENNFDYDDGEPYDDFGLDGVDGTCQYTNGTDECYDYGEGDGEYTRNPNQVAWLETDAAYTLGNMTEAERARVNIWSDAGIRDFLNNAVTNNMGAATMMAHLDMPMGVYDGFAILTGAGNDAVFDFADIDWPSIPPNGYVRYGNPDATEAQILAGDGRHVGTALQLVNRITTMFHWLQAQWPEGDRRDAGAGQIIEDLSFVSPTTGRETPYSLFLPPGYEDNPDLSYPVVYFLHGYGQSPEDLVLASAVFENYMINPDWEEYQRFQKLIIVYVDGRCRPTMSGVPVDPTGDGCERGTWYTDAPLGGPAAMETHMFELVDFIDATYRVKPPETLTVVP
jgi:S-formylglutathione hydrolase FrmB